MLQLSLSAPPEASVQQLVQFQNDLAHMGNRKHQHVPTLRKAAPVQASTRVFIAPHTDFTQHPAWPSKILGLYILLADDTEEGFESETSSWEPELHPWQQEAANVLFFTFIHPDTMSIPPSYVKLAASRGTGLPGAVPKETFIMFAIGGYAYSLKPNPWHWLTSKAAAEEMAVEVAAWPEKYGCDGIDLDLEEGAGAKAEAGPNMIHFIKKIREIRAAAGLPRMVISQPCYGYPQVQAESDVINAGWNKQGEDQGLIDSIGLMVYNGADSLNYVVKYNDGPGLGEWGSWFPIKAKVPKKAILLGAQGNTGAGAISKMASAAVAEDMLGIMVWYSSVKNGFQYKPSGPWDASDSQEAIGAYKAAAELFKPHNFRKTPEDPVVEVETMEEQANGEQINKEENSGEQNNGEGVRHA